MILVAGSTGLVGMEVCRLLVQQGTPVRALVRYSSAPEKVQELRSLGVELCYGNLRDYTSLRPACRDVAAVISTASSTFSRQEGDTIESVDHHGQLTLVDAAQLEQVPHFVFVSFPNDPALQYPLTQAKRAVAGMLKETRMPYTIVESCWFMEVWLSPMVGFDYANATAQIYGDGTKPLSWISAFDVAKFLVAALDEPSPRHETIQIGGPQALTPREVVAIFEEVGGRPFQVNYVAVETLEQQFADATDPLQKSFTGLMLQYAHGVTMDMSEILTRMPVAMTAVRDYAQRVLKREPLTTA